MARWEFGRELRKHIPEGKKQLPKGLREKVAEHYKVEASEITRRLQLAREFDSREKVEAACTKHGNSWRQIIANELIKSRASRDVAWDDRVRRVAKSFDALMQEASGSDDRHATLKQMVAEKARALGLDVAEAES